MSESFWKFTDDATEQRWEYLKKKALSKILGYCSCCSCLGVLSGCGLWVSVFRAVIASIIERAANWVLQLILLLVAPILICASNLGTLWIGGTAERMQRDTPYVPPVREHARRFCSIRKACTGWSKQH